MKLMDENIAYIQNIVNTAQLVGIDDIIIEPNLVRAIDEKKTVVLFHNTNVPDMPFNAIGLNRISSFTARYNIARSRPNFSITASVSEDNNETWASFLTMKGQGVKIDYRCANPRTIKAPRQLNDTQQFQVQLNPEAVGLLQKGQAAMDAEQVSIISNDGVSFELIDINNDVFKHTFALNAVALDGSENTKFAHRYPAKTILALFKQNPDGCFTVGQKGILSIPVNDIDVFVLPRV